jgi:hypothetical protein
MKVIFTGSLAAVLLAISLTGWRLSTAPGAYVIGGEYVIVAGEVIHGNLQVLFAQITLEEGARVDGQIIALSSTLDLAGSVGGSVLAVESDVTVRATAELLQAPRQVEAIPFVVLLPQLARTGYAAELAR